MFNKNFYPSPEKVCSLLTENLFSHSGRILEPSAGKGDLAEKIQQVCGKQAKVECIELENELVAILQSKGFSVVAEDFLDFATSTEYGAIIMNPPFDVGEKHLLHAITLAESQVATECEIRCILNAETIRNPYTATRKELAQKLDTYGAEMTFHDNLFSSAERKTDVETVIIKVKVNSSKSIAQFNYSKLFSNIADGGEDKEFIHSLSTVVHQQEIQKRFTDIKTLVIQYEYHIALIKQQYSISSQLAYTESLLHIDGKGVNSYTQKLPDINEVIERVRGRYWELILQTKDFREVLTEHGRQQISKYISNAAELEINYSNIQMLLMALFQNTDNILMDSCVAMFEKLTKHHYASFSTNIHYYSGWCTNDAFKVNKKIIVPFTPSWGSMRGTDMGRSYGSDEILFTHVTYDVRNFMNDLTKMFKLLKPEADGEFKTLELGEFENELFRFKMFTKGTVHIWFKDLQLLEKFNVLCGQHFNWIPSDDEIKQSKQAQDFMQEHFSNYSNTLLKLGK